MRTTPQCVRGPLARIPRKRLKSTALGLFLFAFVTATQAQVYEKVYSFTDARAAAPRINRGRNIYPGLVEDSNGNFYGATTGGGAYDFGTIFRMTPDGAVTTLVDFTGNGASNRGQYPVASLVRGSDGNFYGTTAQGGTGNAGTVFNMTPGGVLTTLVDFTVNGASNKGSSPNGGLVQGSDGNFYGTTTQGGANNLGTVFKMTPGGVLTTLVQLTGNGVSNKGSLPYGVLVEGCDGNFYGTTAQGGANDLGTVFQMTPGGVATTLVEFTGNGATNKGSSPYGGLVRGSDGNFYGTTYYGGANQYDPANGSYGYGTVFQMTAAGVLTTFVQFTGNDGSYKGGFPHAGLVQGSDGNFYGTTSFGGSSNGTVFKMTPAGTFTNLVNFTGNVASNKGNDPIASLVQGSDGNFYGTTYQGGVNNDGTAFKMTPAGTLATLVEFTGDAGSNPYAGVAQGSDGNLYGTTFNGGASELGTVFKMTAAGDLTTLVEFTGNGAVNMGGNPYAGLVQGSDGNFYGVTAFGGDNGRGTVFKMTPGGALTTLVNFTGNGASNKGNDPDAALVQGSDGNFYGTTYFGGANDAGTVFKMTPAGALTTLVEFTGNGGSNKGSNPIASLVQGGDGNFYGTTSHGGANDLGTVFQMTPAGVLTTLVEFTGNGASNKGSNPIASLVQGSDGNFYGPTEYGGANNVGTVFQMTPGGALTTLVEFTANGTSNKGSRPESSLVQGGDRNFYGTTIAGGASDAGTIFKMTPGGALTTLFDFTADSVDSQPRAALIIGSDGSLYGTAGGGFSSNGSIYRLVYPGPPDVFLAKPAVTNTSAVVRAKIDARGATTTVTLEYGNDGVNFPNTVPVASNLTGYQRTLVGTTLGGLNPGATYYYRFDATSSAGTTVSAVASFTTLAQPTAAVNAASNITQTSARFNGMVNALNDDATVHFEYGTDGNTFPNQVSAVPGTVTGNANTAVSAAVAGLIKGTTYYYRVVATNMGGTTVSGVRSFTTLTEPTATVGGAVALSTISAQVSGSANARGSDTQVVFEYGTDGINFPNSVAATPATVTGNIDSAVSAVLNNLTQGATYYYRIKGTSAGGIGVSDAASFSLNILSGLTQVFPGAPPSAQGFVIVTLDPSGIQSGWRFVGEQLWRASGSVAGGLTTGDRQIEFRPVPGYIQPLTETITVTSGAATQITAEYFPTTAGQAGGLEVILKPDSIANIGLPVANRGQWRFLGEDDTQWRNSGITVNGLLPGKYLLECKPIPGRNTPSPNVVPVQSNQTALATITYYSADATVGATPSVLPFQTVSTTQSLPYAYVGQIRSDVGSATGFVVNRRVVATAGHVVFDDGTLSYVTGLQWLFQRDAGTYDPVPQIPQGFYVFDGYAAQRTAENTPGQSTVASQNLDVAALYFLADAGRGGYAGFLASDSTDNEFLVSSKLKMVVGYPVDGIPSVNLGRMFATSPFNVTFTRVPGNDSNNNPYRVYTTQDITSAGGNSGGPICVLYDNGNYYPAAIYLGGSAQTSVRAIDSKVVDLFGRAEVSGDGGGNQVGGGIIQVNTPISGAIFQAAALKVNLAPDTAVNGGAMWSLSLTDVPFPNGFERDNLNSVGTYTLYFAPATGFLTPPSATITLTAGQLSTVTRTYFGVTTQPQNQIAPVGNNVTFSVATSATPTGYQWRRNGFNISGATASSYALNNVTSNDTATYSVIVTWTEVAPSTVTGPVSQTSSAATLTVTDTFNSWSSRFFTPTELTNSQISGPAADADGDGVPNLLEFAFNLQPRIADRSVIVAGTSTSGLPLIRLETINNQKVLTIEFVRRRAAGSPGITYHAEFNSDLTDPSGWSESGTATVTQIDDTWERVKVIDSLVNQTKRLSRVRVTTP
jgi:uncharacterized repeat protein (TIGR03803 family)